MQSETHLLLHTHHAHYTYGLVVAKHVWICIIISINYWGLDKEGWEFIGPRGYSIE